LFYKDLNIYEWSQGILAIMEAEEELSIIKRMLAHYRAVYRDMQNHGFEALKWASGVILSLLEKGKLTWSQEEKMAEERRSALTVASNPPKESLPPPIPGGIRGSTGNPKVTIFSPAGLIIMPGLGLGVTGR
jgi:hypothetical protein